MLRRNQSLDMEATSMQSLELGATSNQTFKMLRGKIRNFIRDMEPLPRFGRIVLNSNYTFEKGPISVGVIWVLWTLFLNEFRSPYSKFPQQNISLKLKKKYLQNPPLKNVWDPLKKTKSLKFFHQIFWFLHIEVWESSLNLLLFKETLEWDFKNGFKLQLYYSLTLSMGICIKMF